MSRIVLSNPDDAIRAQVREILSEYGHEVAGEAVDPAGYAELCEKLRPDILVTDLFPEDGLDGLAEARRLRSSHGIEFIVLTSCGDRVRLARTVEALPSDILLTRGVKPGRLQLLSAIDLASRRGRGPGSVGTDSGRAAEQDGILLVDDEHIVGLDLERRFGRDGYPVVGVAANGEDAVCMARELRPALVVMDYSLCCGDVDGDRATIEIRENPGVPVMYCTSYTDDRTILDILVPTAPDSIRFKPFEELEVLVGADLALARSGRRHPRYDPQGLFLSLRRGDPEGVRRALAAGADPLAVDPWGKAPLELVPDGPPGLECGALLREALEKSGRGSPR